MANNENQIDTHLWQRLKNGHGDALAAMMRLYYNPLMGYGLKISLNPELTKDAIQNVFYYIWRKRESLGDVENIKSYLITSLRNELIRQLNENNKNVTIEKIDETEPDISFSAEEQIIHHQDAIIKKELLVRSINSLPKRQREIIYLKFVAGLDTNAIAGIMGLQAQSVYNLLSDALKALRKMLDGQSVLH